mgnify:CR=1 FL=1
MIRTRSLGRLLQRALPLRPARSGPGRTTALAGFLLWRALRDEQFYRQVLAAQVLKIDGAG